MLADVVSASPTLETADAEQLIAFLCILRRVMFVLCFLLILSISSSNASTSSLVAGSAIAINVCYIWLSCMVLISHYPANSSSKAA